MDIANLTRYKWALHSVRAGGIGIGTVVKDDDGEYIKFEDVKELLEHATNSQSDKIIADIKVVVGSWFKSNDDLTHRECDILNSIVKCYKKR